MGTNNKKQSKADKILALHPGENKVYITADLQSFFTKGDAVNHSKKRNFKTPPEEFFRKGHESQDKENLEAIEVEFSELSKDFQAVKTDLESAQKENEALIAENAELKSAMENSLKQNESFTKHILELEAQTEELKKANEQLKKENEGLKLELSELKKQTVEPKSKEQSAQPKKDKK